MHQFYQWKRFQDRTFIDEINPVDGRHSIAATTTMEGCWLPFYKKGLLVRLVDRSWTPSRLEVYYLALEHEAHRLQGCADPIYAVNAQDELSLDLWNVLDYLRFFLFFMRGCDGPFLMMDPQAASFLPDEMDPRTRAAIESSARPARCEGRSDKGAYMCSSVILYSDGLFESLFAIDPGGNVEMLSDAVLAEELAVTGLHAPIA